MLQRQTNIVNNLRTAQLTRIIKSTRNIISTSRDETDFWAFAIAQPKPHKKALCTSALQNHCAVFASSALPNQSHHSRSHRPLYNIFSRPWIFGWMLLTLSNSDLLLATVGHLSTCWALVFLMWPSQVWHTTLTFESDTDNVEANQHAKYLSQKSLNSKAIKSINQSVILQRPKWQCHCYRTAMGVKKCHMIMSGNDYWNSVCFSCCRKAETNWLTWHCQAACSRTVLLPPEMLDHRWLTDTDRQTHAHIGPTALPRPLKWSVKTSFAAVKRKILKSPVRSNLNSDETENHNKISPPVLE